jgi:hypothetical protein
VANSDGGGAMMFRVRDDEALGTDLPLRGAVAVTKLAAAAEEKGSLDQLLVMKKHESGGWRKGRRSAISAPCPAPPPPPPPPDSLAAWLVNVRRKGNPFEVLAPALASLPLCSGLTDLQLLLVAEACGPPETAMPGTVVAGGGQSSSSGAMVPPSMLVVHSGFLDVRRLAAPQRLPPKFDDDAVNDEVAAMGTEAGGGGGAEEETTVMMTVKRLRRLSTGDVYGERNLYAPHEVFAQEG